MNCFQRIRRQEKRLDKVSDLGYRYNTTLKEPLQTQNETEDFNTLKNLLKKGTEQNE